VETAFLLLVPIRDYVVTGLQPYDFSTSSLSATVTQIKVHQLAINGLPGHAVFLNYLVSAVLTYLNLFSV